VLERALVTGGAGFIGSHVAERLAESGCETLVVDDLSAGKPENVPEGVELRELDIRSPELARVVADFGPAAIFHLAAQASVTASVRDPEHDLDVNVRGTINVLEAAREVGAPTIFASTGGALYGDDVPLPTPEETRAQPGSPYGASKLAGEGYITTWSRLHALPNVVLRLGNVYGPRQEQHGEAGVVAIFSSCLLEDRRPTVFGGGAPTRDYVFVGDVADAFLRAAESGRGGTYNVGTGVATSVTRLLELLQQIAGTSVEAEHAPLRPGELRASALDSTRIRDALAWGPQVELEDGLRTTFRSFAG
jgi:UDP-glucose 4-epimerase